MNAGPIGASPVTVGTRWAWGGWLAFPHQPEDDDPNHHGWSNADPLTGTANASWWINPSLPLYFRDDYFFHEWYLGDFEDYVETKASRLGFSVNRLQDTYSAWKYAQDKMAGNQFAKVNSTVFSWWHSPGGDLPLAVMNLADLSEIHLPVYGPIAVAYGSDGSYRSLVYKPHLSVPVIDPEDEDCWRVAPLLLPAVYVKGKIAHVFGDPLYYADGVTHHLDPNGGIARTWVGGVHALDRTTLQVLLVHNAETVSALRLSLSGDYRNNTVTALGASADDIDLPGAGASADVIDLPGDASDWRFWSPWRWRSDGLEARTVAGHWDTTNEVWVACLVVLHFVSESGVVTYLYADTTDYLSTLTEVVAGGGETYTWAESASGAIQTPIAASYAGATPLTAWLDYAGCSWSATQTWVVNVGEWAWNQTIDVEMTHTGLPKITVGAVTAALATETLPGSSSVYYAFYELREGMSSGETAERSSTGSASLGVRRLAHLNLAQDRWVWVEDAFSPARSVSSTSTSWYYQEGVCVDEGYTSSDSATGGSRLVVDATTLALSTVSGESESEGSSFNPLANPFPGYPVGTTTIPLSTWDLIGSRPLWHGGPIAITVLSDPRPAPGLASAWIVQAHLPAYDFYEQSVAAITAPFSSITGLAGALQSTYGSDVALSPLGFY